LNSNWDGHERRFAPGALAARRFVSVNAASVKKSLHAVDAVNRISDDK
jgi:hypothetical protein